MKLSQLIETKPTRNLFGKGSGHTAHLVEQEHIKAEGESTEEAQLKLAFRLREHFKNAHKRHYFFSKSGKTMFALYHSFHGWCYDVTSATHKHASTCSFNPGCTEAEATQMVINHAEQYED